MTSSMPTFTLQRSQKEKINEQKCYMKKQWLKTSLPQEGNRPLGPGSIAIQVRLTHRSTSRHINIKLSTIFFCFFFFQLQFYFIFKLYKIVLVLPNIKMNPPQVYRILKAARQQQIVTFKETCRRLSDDFFSKNMQARNEYHGHDAFKVMKGKTSN